MTIPCSFDLRLYEATLFFLLGTVPGATERIGPSSNAKINRTLLMHQLPSISRQPFAIAQYDVSQRTTPLWLLVVSSAWTTQAPPYGQENARHFPGLISTGQVELEMVSPGSNGWLDHGHNCGIDISGKPIKIGHSFDHIDRL